jgi:hypothetical protein
MLHGNVFANAPDERHMWIMADGYEIRAAVAEDPAACVELWWGEADHCVVVDLRQVTPKLLEDLLSNAWKRHFPGTAL